MNVFITGITGSLGSALAKWHTDHGGAVWGCARNERRVVECRDAEPWGQRILCENAANLDRVLTGLAFRDAGVKRVYHCAALKHVEHAEASPEEAVYQNLTVLQAVIAACKMHGCELIVPGSDKACLPSGVYGATKLLAERLVVDCGFSVVRFGNLLGSSGCVFERWQNQDRMGRPIELTDPNMTRFFVALDDAARIMAMEAIRGRVVIPEMRAVCMGEVAALWPNVRVVGIRPGERLHEWAIAPGERSVRKNGVYIVGEGEVDNGGYGSQCAPRWRLTEFAEVLSRNVNHRMCG